MKIILMILIIFTSYGCSLLFDRCYNPLAVGDLKYCECSGYCESQENCDKCKEGR